jgi:phage replication-related protein YjqB (UPF0714/DUF867 family)
MPTGYDAQILKLDLPEQEALKNDAERCSADPAMLESIGRAVGHQVRIRAADPGFVALFTVRQANPQGDLSTPSRANVVRTGQAGRERLGTDAEMKAVVQARVVDSPPLFGEPEGVRFFEEAEDDGEQIYFIAIAPHGGEIEPHTDEEVVHLRTELVSKGYPASSWICKGFGDSRQRAFDRWHITSTDIHPASFPVLRTIITRRFCHGVAFHGFAKRAGEADLYIGGEASELLKGTIKDTLDALYLPLQVKIATKTDKAKFQGFRPANLINRLAVQGIHIEQSREAREFCERIAKAIATVYQSP